MNRLELSLLYVLGLVVCSVGFGMFVTEQETRVLAAICGIAIVLLGLIVVSLCLKPFGDEDSEEKKVLKELADHLRITAEINPRHQETGERVGSVSLSTEDYALWKKVILVLGEEPDPIADAFRQLRRD